MTYDGTNNRNRLIYDAVGEYITYYKAMSIIQNLYDMKLINDREGELMKIAINDRTLINVEDKNKIRADILKGMLMTVLS